jgi:ADP-ribose pyrophosphatase
MNLTEKALATRRAFEGRAVVVDVMDVELPDGRRTVREIVRHRGAAVILGQCPDGRFVFVRQYRRAIDQILLEAVAGGLEPGESAETCARREMEEESGYRVLTLQKIGVVVPCPGYSEERLHLFYATLPATAQGQRPDVDENLEPVLLTAAQIDEALDSGLLTDGKTIALWLMWRRGRNIRIAVSDAQRG